MQLTDKDLDVIACTAFDAKLSVVEIGRQTGHKDHVVRHSLMRMREAGVINLRPYVNPYALGLLEFHAFITVLTPGEGALRSLIQACVAAPTTTFVGEVSGEYHIALMFLTSSLEGIASFFDSICERAPNVEFTKIVMPAIEVIMAAPKRSVPAGEGNNTISYGAVRSPQTVDELDQKILALLGASQVYSKKDLAQKCGAPASTVEYRVQALQDRGVLLGIGHEVPSYRDGLFPFVFRVYASRPCRELHDLMRGLMRSHPAVRCLVCTCGQWDYDLSVRLTHPGTVSALTQELHSYLGKFVTRIDALPVLQSHKLYINPQDFALVSELLRT